MGFQVVPLWVPVQMGSRKLKSDIWHLKLQDIAADISTTLFALTGACCGSTSVSLQRTRILSTAWKSSIFLDWRYATSPWERAWVLRLGTLTAVTEFLDAHEIFSNRNVAIFSIFVHCSCALKNLPMVQYQTNNSPYSFEYHFNPHLLMCTRSNTWCES